MQSNIGADILLNSIAQTGSITRDLESSLMNRLKSHFLPEFLNRLDDICIFSPLSRESLIKILDQQLQVATAGLKSPDKNITVSLDSGAAEVLLELGYDPLFGARPLRRLIEHKIITQLSQLIVSGNIPPNSRVFIEATQDDEGRKQFKYNVEGPRTAQFLQALDEQ